MYRIKASKESGNWRKDGHWWVTKVWDDGWTRVERVKNSQVWIQQVSCLRKEVGSCGTVQRSGFDDQSLIKCYDVYTTLFFAQCTALLRSQLFRYEYSQPKFRCNDATDKRSSFPLPLTLRGTNEKQILIRMRGKRNMLGSLNR